MAAPPEQIREQARVSGVVQGVGFRPFVHNLARDLGLSGWVTNTAAGVELAVQGPAPAIEEFFHRLEAEAPPLALIQEVGRQPLEPLAGQSGFVILASQAGTRRTLISPDSAVCSACLAEMRDPADRRHGYAFINCTHCGPRYTIIKDIPYDRPLTTMAPFVMCPACQAEYDDPANRRFHAQPNACPACGPRLWLAGAAGREMAVADPIAEAASALRQGLIVAIKGLGGFHLAVDPFNEEAVARLRGRKLREEKPLALMVAGLDAARALAHLDALAQEALSSRQRPIVLAPMREGTGLAPSLNPRNRLLGLMLPYTPLHHLLMDQGFTALVMTSGNVSDEPICLDNAEALCRIGGQAPCGAIADLFLLHDRDIYLRSDDSVVRSLGGALRQIRRSRGYAPAPLTLAPGLVAEDAPPVLAVGALLKNTLCLLRGRQAFVSQHVGDLENLETLGFFELTAGHLARILEAQPTLLACDLHPDYLSTRWALEQGLPVVMVQHHHAHAVAVMAEHGLSGEVLGLSLDGTGYGPDRTVWGGELLAAQAHTYRRLGHLRHLYLPGGDRAVKEPWRVGLALLLQVLGESAAGLDLGLIKSHGQHLPLLARMVGQGINSPATSSLGRLFDGVAALSGLRTQVAYEGQAAIELEQALDPGEQGAYPFGVLDERGLLVLDWQPALQALVADLLAGATPGVVSARFHQGLTQGLAAWARAAAERTGLERVCLGGGCLHNAYLLERLPPLLTARGLQVFTPALLPAGDGGLSLGQALAAAQARELGLIQGQRTILGPDPQETKP
ncbi:MAG: carbamoyltransferase HypF [Desulfarculus sp.]|nr:carbamoyltransferase HypF [Desulfarculus sp.]